MDFKEFFTINKEKRIIVLVLILIAIIITFVNAGFSEIGCSSWSCYNTIHKITIISVEIIALPNFILSEALPSMKINFWIWSILLIIQLLYLYLMACIIYKLFAKKT
jgi:hypothetical protein